MILSGKGYMVSGKCKLVSGKRQVLSGRWKMYFSCFFIFFLDFFLFLSFSRIVLVSVLLSGYFETLLSSLPDAGFKNVSFSHFLK